LACVARVTPLAHATAIFFTPGERRNRSIWGRMGACIAHIEMTVLSTCTADFVAGGCVYANQYFFLASGGSTYVALVVLYSWTSMLRL
jgi:hypothetical protein